MFTVFDLETTGLSSMVHDVIQFAYITYDEKNMPVKAESLYFYYEGMSWTEETYAVHQIPLEFLKQFEDKFEENVIKMYATLMNGNVCGHNAKAFDCVFAKNWLSRMGLYNLKYRCIQDTMYAFKPIAKRPRIKLIKLAEMLGVTDEIVTRMAGYVFKDDMATHAHNAAFDTMRTGIITVLGINKNLIDFSGEIAQAHDYDDSDLYDKEEESLGRDPIGILVKVQNSDGEVDTLYVSPNPEYDTEIPTETEIKNLKETDRCLRRVFEPVGDNLWQIKCNMSVIQLKKEGPKWGAVIQLMDTMPKSEFFEYANRSVFVNAFNKDIPVWED